MPTTEIQFELRGGNEAAYYATDPEILVEGPRGTGKSRTLLEKEYAYAMRYPGIRILLVKKTLKSISGSVAQTMRFQVMQNGDGVTFFGGNEVEPASYKFKNGSAIVMAGLDDPEKLKSSEYSRIYVNEATDLTEDDWQDLKALLRQNLPGVRITKQITGDCNPGDSGHWLNQSCEQGRIRRIKTRLQDNPWLYNADGTLTEEGESYVGRILESYTGARRKRWLDGEWTGVENAIYPAFDRLVHIRPLEPGLLFKETIMGIDYGHQHDSAIVVVSIDQKNRRWVREAWARPDDDEGQSLADAIGRLSRRYNIRRGRVDPNQQVLTYFSKNFFLGENAKLNVAIRDRFARIEMMEPLFYQQPGGVVLTMKERLRMSGRAPVYPDDDSPGIFLVEGMPFIDELANQMESYHYIFKETDKGRVKDVFRDKEDLVAALEDANEEWEVNGSAPVLPNAIPSPLSDEPKQTANGWPRFRRQAASTEWKRRW